MFSSFYQSRRYCALPSSLPSIPSLSPTSTPLPLPSRLGTQRDEFTLLAERVKKQQRCTSSEDDFFSSAGSLPRHLLRLSISLGGLQASLPARSTVRATSRSPRLSYLLYISSHPSPPNHPPFPLTLLTIHSSPLTLLSSPSILTFSPSTLPPHSPLLTAHPHLLSPLHRLSHSSSKDLEQDRAEFEHCFDDWMAISESHTLVMLLSCDPISSSQILLCFWN